MDWSQVTSLTIPEGSVEQVSVNGVVLWRKSLLPSGYTQLEYIESTGTQYIDLGINKIREMECNLVAQLTDTTISGFPTLIGAMKTPDNFKVVVGINSLLQFYSQLGDRSGYIYGSVKGDLNKHSFKVLTSGSSTSNLTIDGNTVNGYYALTIDSDEDVSLYLFTRHKQDGTVSLFIKMRCYELTIKYANKIARNLIPVMRNSDGKVGMYDTVTRQFFTNAGTGEFIAGDFVLPKGYTKLEYLQSDSTAYIDTGIAGGVDTLEVGCKFSWSNFVNYGAVYGNYISDAHNGIRLILSNVDNIIFANSNTICTTTGNTELDCTRNTIHTVVNKYDTINVDGTVTTRTKKVKGTDNSGNIALFNRSITNPNTARDIGIKIYSFYIKNSDELVCNLVPCRRNSDNVLGMYDIVRNIFLTNVGTGEFIAGGAV